MSIHRSLKTQGKLTRLRNVFTRSERLELLKKEKRWTDDVSIFGLPKVKTRLKVKSKKKEKAAAEGEAGAGAAGAPGAAPAAAAAPAKTDKKADKKK
jgi:small basic protein (TIGR04137 family)